jgi:predicted DNA-binding antitoxin AbrB/MazE fold protein
MEKRLQAVYKEGALYPLEPLQLQDMQQVTVYSRGVGRGAAGYRHMERSPERFGGNFWIAL